MATKYGFVMGYFALKYLSAKGLFYGECIFSCVACLRAIESTYFSWPLFDLEVPR